MSRKQPPVLATLQEKHGNLYLNFRRQPTREEAAILYELATRVMLDYDSLPPVGKGNMRA